MSTTKIDNVIRAMSLLREHFPAAVIIVADGDDNTCSQATVFGGNRSCCRGLLADAYDEEFSEIVLETGDDEQEQDE